jgi:hypothetical protein
MQNVIAAARESSNMHKGKQWVTHNGKYDAWNIVTLCEPQQQSSQQRKPQTIINKQNQKTRNQ